MRLFQRAWLPFFFVLFANCSKSETPTPILEEEEKKEPEELETKVYFTLNVLDLNTPEPKEDWIIIHDETGNLIDYERYVLGDTIQFEAPIDSLPEKISVTKLEYFEGGEGTIETHRLRTTTNVDIGAEWTFDSFYEPAYAAFTKTGEFELAIHNIPGILKVHVSTKRRRLYSSPSPSPNAGKTSFVHVFETYEGQDNYLISILDEENNLKYFEFENPNKENITLDYNQFQVYDNYIHMNLPPYIQYFLNVGALEKDEPFGYFGGYRLHDVSSIDAEVSDDPLVFGYLDKYTRYRTRFEISFEKYRYEIHQYGLPLENIPIPEMPNLVVTDPSRYSFQFEVNRDYVSASHEWDYYQGADEVINSSYSSWTIEADKGVIPIRGKLPDEILGKYPRLKPDELRHRSTRLDMPVPGGEYYSRESITLFVLNSN